MTKLASPRGTAPIQTSLEPDDEREMVFQTFDRILDELGDPDSLEALTIVSTLADGAGAPGTLDPEDEAFAAGIRRRLAGIAAAAAAGGPPPGPEVSAALDSTEMVVRGKLMTGNAAQLAPLASSFVFLVTLPIIGHDGAIAISRRVTG